MLAGQNTITFFLAFGKPTYPKGKATNGIWVHKISRLFPNYDCKPKNHQTFMENLQHKYNQKKHNSGHGEKISKDMLDQVWKLSQNINQNDQEKNIRKKPKDKSRGSNI